MLSPKPWGFGLSMTAFLFAFECIFFSKQARLRENNPERGTTMPGLKQSELNWIRETVPGHQLTAGKLSDYANQVNDPQLKQMFTQASTQATQAANKLLQHL